ncbi:glycoside hydrolase family 55 protein [Streptomyces sp. BHT-5-2]|uniref:glycoside hydrolase family 55 protein n=1 Tax=Streptomyces sp. BHT-5-2 TaxID=2866715 RepID=UPI001C8ED436|nr:glycoside hydrolase family 55 protein [Streptomyces sp. BHT-5-2]QZL04998.1 glycoside hydrolase family 55 protein [Streptomyces sp. BHT-5-2]
MAGRPSPSNGAPGRRTILAASAATLAAVLTGCDSDSPDPSDEDAVPPRISGTKPKGRDVIDVVADCGAKGDGRTDDSRAFARAYAHAAGRVWDHIGRTVIDIPAGTYLIASPYALLNAPAGRLKANGLRFRGAGKRMTQLLFAPNRPQNAFLCRNEDSWANVSFEELAFRSGTPGASFFSSYSTGQAQDYRFTACEWTGEWTYGLALDGSNTNSEMRWDACRIGGSYRKAFLYSGLSQKSLDHPQQDQFLNYWFTDMKVEYDWGNFLEFPYGGSITCRGGSYIVTGRRPTDSADYGRTSTFFRFPRGVHHDSVQRFHAEDIRFEVRGPDTVVIDCAWDGGTVHFNDCDDTALAFRPFAKDSRPHRYRSGARGALVRYDSCQLSGQHLYEQDGNGPRARYDMCVLRNHAPADFIAGASAGVQFTDCLGP